MKLPRVYCGLQNKDIFSVIYLNKYSNSFNEENFNDTFQNVLLKLFKRQNKNNRIYVSELNKCKREYIEIAESAGYSCEVHDDGVIINLTIIQKDKRIELINTDPFLSSIPQTIDELKSRIEAVLIFLKNIKDRFYIKSKEHGGFFDYQGSLLPYTVAGASMGIFRWISSCNFSREKYLNLLEDKLLLGKSKLTIENYVRPSYYGGYLYKSDIAEKYHGKGTVYDVNNMYPSIMNSDKKFPVGAGYKFKSYNKEPEITDGTYKFIRFRAKFELKKDHLPILRRRRRRSAELIVSSCEEILGKQINKSLEFTLSETDYLKFKENYVIHEIEHIDYMEFKTMKGYEIFKPFVETMAEYKTIFAVNKDLKKFIKGCMAMLSGKLGSKDGKGYVPIASAITSYGRELIIDKAEKNYDRFLYSDTDSLHLTGTKDPVDIEVSEYEIGKFKKETVFKECSYLKSKTYLQITEGDELIIKASGLHKRGQLLVSAALNKVLKGYTLDDYKKLKLTDEEFKYIDYHRNNRITTIDIYDKMPSDLGNEYYMYA